ncbi:hypothetical protein HII13_003640 [Brettanomyces bruxellensis]|nr:hypothetical protein HII13_003640 [Brettanomyces bruxellensis]
MDSLTTAYDKKRDTLLKALSRINEVVTDEVVDVVRKIFQSEVGNKHRFTDVLSLVLFKEHCLVTIVNHSLIPNNLKDDIKTVMDSTVIEDYDVGPIQRLIEEAIGNQVLLPDDQLLNVDGSVIRSMNLLLKKAQHFPFSKTYLKEFVQKNINASPEQIFNKWTKINRSLGNDTGFSLPDRFILYTFAEAKGKEFSDKFEDKISHFINMNQMSLDSNRLNKVYIDSYQRICDKCKPSTKVESGSAEVNSLSKHYHGKFNNRKSHEKHRGDRKKQFRCYFCGATDHRVAQCPKMKKAAEAAKTDKTAEANVLTDDVTDEDVEGPEFILDSGSTHHIVNDKHLLRKISTMKIAVNGPVGRAKATICGSVDIGNLHLSDVLYLPSCDYNLISLVRLFKEGYDLECHYPLATISKNGVTYGHARKGRQGFLVLDNPVKPIVMNVTAENSSAGQEVLVRALTGSEGAEADSSVREKVLHGVVEDSVVEAGSPVKASFN